MSLILALAVVAAQPVAYGDLDLSRARDVARLDVRLGTAVRTVCGTPSAADLAGQNQLRRCRAATRAAAATSRDRVVAGARASQMAGR